MFVIVKLRNSSDGVLKRLQVIGPFDTREEARLALAAQNYSRPWYGFVVPLASPDEES